MNRTDKLILVSWNTGFIVAICLSFVWQYINAHVSKRTPAIAVIDSVTGMLWPSNLMMMPTEHSGVIGYIFILLLSCAVNGLIYCFVVCVGAFFVQQLFKGAKKVFKRLP